MNFKADIEHAQLEKLRQQRYDALSKERTIENEEAKRREKIFGKGRHGT